MSEEGAVFARSGAFRVDRALALEKLSRFALARGELFLLPWLRSAVAARARRLRADGAMSLRVAFDGDAFTREELADPYAALLQEA
ncbi:MAG: hypothetical protein HY554_03695, partial [Elusimicrobia bacterium]|nr:hypothetical protein [Elusimicrobiota bacterium]